MGKTDNGIFKRINDKRNVIASMPALLLCVATLFVLLLDITMPSMKDAQYLVYPILFRIVGLISLLFTSLCLAIDIDNDSLHMDASDICFVVFFVCVVISTCINGWSSQALFGLKYRYIGVLDLFIFMVSYMYCSCRIRSEKWKDTILIGFITVADIIAVTFICSETFAHIPAFEGKLDFAGMFYHGNHYGYFLSIAVAIAAAYFVLDEGRKAAIGGFSFALNCIVMLINQTRGSVLGAGFAIILLIIWLLIKEKGKSKKARYLAIGFPLAIVLSLLFSGGFRAEVTEMTKEMLLILSGTNDLFAGNGRWGIWQYVIDWTMERPVWGFGNEGIADTLYELAETPSPHNEPLTYAAFFGIPAAVSYIVGVLIRIVDTLRNKTADNTEIIAGIAATAYFISSVFGVAMFYTTPFLFIMLGLCHREKSCKRDAL